MQVFHSSRNETGALPGPGEWVGLCHPQHVRPCRTVFRCPECNRLYVNRVSHHAPIATIAFPCIWAKPEIEFPWPHEAGQLPLVDHGCRFVRNLALHRFDFPHVGMIRVFEGEAWTYHGSLWHKGTLPLNVAAPHPSLAAIPLDDEGWLKQFGPGDWWRELPCP